MNYSVKDILKMIYYSRFGSIIRYLPERIVLNNRCKVCRKSLDFIRKSDKKKIIRVVFLMEYPEVWNSSKTVFESLNNSDKAEAYIITLPKYPNLDYNDTFLTFSNLYTNVIKGYDSGKWFDLEAFAPDYVFYTRPYAKEYPDELKPAQVSKYAKLCYLPYGFDFTEGYHIQVQYNLHTFPYMYMVFCDDSSAKKYCDKMFRNEGDYKKVFDIGYPRFDLLYRLKKSIVSDVKKTTILWVPRWSLERLANDGSSYFDFIEILINFFTSGSKNNLNLIIRPHPLMFGNFVKNGVMSKYEVDNIHDRINAIDNISFDTNSDYLISARQADLIIADFTSMLIEYVMLDKPVIYCGSTAKFTEVGRKVDKAMYHLSDYKDVINGIETFLSEGDTMKEIRATVISELSKGNDGKIGDRITEQIIKDYFNIE